MTMLLWVLLALFVVQAAATVITTVPVSARITIPALNYFGSGPQMGLGPVAYTWTSTNAFNDGGSVFGFTFPYGFGDNGSWDGSLGPMAGVNNSFDYSGITDTMTFQFATPIQVVGGFFNYVPGGSTPTTIAVYDTNNVLIESYDLTFFTGPGVNLGEWLGFQETTPIGYFTMSDNFIAIASPTPEPSTLAFLGTGALGLAGVIRRKPML